MQIHPNIYVPVSLQTLAMLVQKSAEIYANETRNAAGQLDKS